MKDRESEEMYLETILLLKKENAFVRSVDIVNELDYAKSSVSRAVNLLQKRGYIVMNSETGDITLTECGQKKAENIYDRHRVLTAMFEHFGADKELSETNACRVEHVISEDMFELIKKVVQKE